MATTELLIFRAVFDIITAANAASSGDPLEGLLKNIYKGNKDRQLNDETPCVIIHPDNDQLEGWEGLPNERGTRIRILVRCVSGPQDITGAAEAVEGAIELGALVKKALIKPVVGYPLNGESDLVNVLTEAYTNIGSDKYESVIAVETEKREVAV